MLTDPPLEAELEVSIFSRGYGESIVIHTGEGVWLVIDSLLTAGGRPVALEYFDAIGVDAATAVRAVLITHWHDDHVAGAAELVAQASSALIALSSSLQTDEFKALLKAKGTPLGGSFGNGVQELYLVLTEIIKNSRSRKWCNADKSISEDRLHGSYRFEALSPSEGDFETFVAALAQLNLTDTRLKAPERNDASVASVVAARGEIMLFGADLEVTRSGSGWEEVHEVVWQGRGRASLYKIPHHGSANANHDGVWADMLTTNVIAALTPWNRGRKLPKPTDVTRIIGQTSNAHSAARALSSKSLSRLNAVEKSLRQAKIKITTPATDLGHLRMRNDGGGWVANYANPISCKLGDVRKPSAG